MIVQDRQIEERLLFGGPAPAEIGQLLNEAMAAYRDTARAERLLWQAQALDPGCLPVYFSLYKFYFYQKRLADDERTAVMGLSAAARLGNFPEDWRALTPACADWSAPRSPQRFYLFSLKALAFIRLRRKQTADSAAILEKLRTLDPHDQVGGSVIATLAAAVAY